MLHTTISSHSPITEDRPGTIRSRCDCVSEGESKCRLKCLAEMLSHTVSYKGPFINLPKRERRDRYMIFLVFSNRDFVSINYFIN